MMRVILKLAKKPTTTIALYIVFGNRWLIAILP